jgi:hypothetical protein
MSNFSMSSLMIAQGKPLLGLACTTVGLILIGVQVYEGVQAIRTIRGK